MFTNQRWPHGSTITPPRWPYGVSAGGRCTLAPRCSASAIVASQSGTYSCSDTALASGSGRDDADLGMGVGQHDQRPAEPQLGVTDAAVGHHDRVHVRGGAEDLLVPGHRLPGAVDGDVRRERRHLVGHPRGRGGGVGGERHGSSSSGSRTWWWSWSSWCRPARGRRRCGGAGRRRTPGGERSA